MVASEQHLYQTIVLPRKLTTGRIPLMGILFEILRIAGPHFIIKIIYCSLSISPLD